MRAKASSAICSKHFPKKITQVTQRFFFEFLKRLAPAKQFPFSYSSQLYLSIMAIGKALAVSFGALAGGAAGFYVLEMYKIKSKVRN